MIYFSWVSWSYCVVFLVYHHQMVSSHNLQCIQRVWLLLSTKSNPGCQKQKSRMCSSHKLFGSCYIFFKFWEFYKRIRDGSYTITSTIGCKCYSYAPCMFCKNSTKAHGLQ